MKRIVTVLLMCLIIHSIQAQTDTENKMLTGFSLGMNYSDIHPEILENASSDAVVVQNGPGLRLGLLVENKLSSHLFLASKAELALNQCRILFNHSNESTEEYSIHQSNLEFAFHLGYRIYNEKSGPYILFGPSIRWPLIDSDRLPAAYSDKLDLGIDVGAGFEQLLPHFRFAPEVRYSLGMNNISDRPSVEKLYVHYVTLLLTFKG